jgi:uncharacterized protein (TIGR02246 family)
VSADDELRALYGQLLAAWNAGSASGMAAVFAEDGESVGFDGSHTAGRAQIAAELERIFRDHPTGRYVGIVRGVRPLAGGGALLRAVSGIVPAGRDGLEPSLNAQQALVAEHDGSAWRVVLFQNTPAQYHGRPEAAEALTRELQGVLESGG